MIASVKKTKSNPYYVLFEEDNKHFLKKVKKPILLLGNHAQMFGSLMVQYILLTRDQY